MYCEVAREALSARLDGEREPVPAARVDEHLEECAECRAWLEQVQSQADELSLMLQSRPVIAPLAPLDLGPVPPRRRVRLSGLRWALLVVGIAQVALSTVQGLGLDLGLTHDHGMGSAHHLLNESTAWSMALGVIMVGAALWPAAAAGLAGVLTVFVAVLAIYVVVDAMSGAVTLTRIGTHIPVLIGAVLATLVWRRTTAPPPDGAAAEPDIVLPPNASRGRRRGHLWPTDGSAA
ncbi:zf-HC2 domain-containing protein [Mycobacterium vicinigordonae]|uniref:Zf-HC2 domain-containing protein n=1 Tax=Mycobacterium vicinigordonae TaxID=1719132 RepID=A0A7D6E648_9MYCO|nr:zf-HC2 domain-containing protein [Mycobacterium vicinigordonae]QLL10066.1 zf-HC2 domain-containing protein [Mycobacterium vicinigordonae]